ncbi:MAG: cytochrome c oxidase subunit 3 [Actinomycetota bacterium]
MLALPSAPAPAPRRQMLVGTALAVGGAATFTGALLALYVKFRHEALAAADGRWIPKGIKVPLVPANVLIISLIPICLFAQWAVYSAKRDDKQHTGLALGLVALMGVAFINAQAFIWETMKLPVHQGTYSYLFYTLTGTMVALAIIGVVFSAATAFRYLGGRTADREVVSAHALYWYAFSVVFSALWFVVYVIK